MTNDSQSLNTFHWLYNPLFGMNRDTYKQDYSSLFYSNPCPTYVFDLDTFHVLDFNTAALKLFGYTKEEFLNLSLEVLHPNSKRVLIYKSLTNCDNPDGGINYGLIDHQNISGEIIQMKVNGHIINYSEKKCMILFCQDVTEAEIQRKLLKDSEEN